MPYNRRILKYERRGSKEKRSKRSLEISINCFREIKKSLGGVMKFIKYLFVIIYSYRILDAVFHSPLTKAEPVLRYFFAEAHYFIYDLVLYVYLPFLLIKVAKKIIAFVAGKQPPHQQLDKIEMSSQEQMSSLLERYRQLSQEKKIEFEKRLEQLGYSLESSPRLRALP